MQDLGVIVPIEEPTDWCTGMVVVPNGTVRICVDLTKLRREKHQLPSVDHTLGQLKNANVFTKLDVNSGFCHLALVQHLNIFTGECPTSLMIYLEYCAELMMFFQWRISRAA